MTERVGDVDHTRAVDGDAVGLVETRDGERCSVSRAKRSGRARIRARHITGRNLANRRVVGIRDIHIARRVDCNTGGKRKARRAQGTIGARPDTSRSTRRGDGAVLRNPTNEMVISVRDVSCARSIHGDTKRVIKPGRSAETIDGPDTPRRAGQSLHDATGRNTTNRVVVRVGHIDVPESIDCHTRRSVETGNISCTVSAPSGIDGSCERRDHTSRRNLTDDVSGRIGDIEIARAVGGNGARIRKLRGCAGAVQGRDHANRACHRGDNGAGADRERGDGARGGRRGINRVGGETLKLVAAHTRGGIGDREGRCGRSRIGSTIRDISESAAGGRLALPLIGRGRGTRRNDGEDDRITDRGRDTGRLGRKSGRCSRGCDAQRKRLIRHGRDPRTGGANGKAERRTRIVRRCTGERSRGGVERRP